MRTLEGQTKVMVTQEDFIELLRDGLSHLYDSEYLRQSRLAELFGVTQRANSASAIRNVLTEGVESLKPPEDVPSQSRDWRLYDALFYAYVQQLEQRIVADQLGLSVRHLRREQRAAVEVLADRLWPRVEEAARSAFGADDAPLLAEMGQPDQGLSRELAWLRDLPADRPTDLSATIGEAQNLVAPLAEQTGTEIEIGEMAGLPALAVHPVALNQIVLNLLSVALSQAEGGTVVVSARRRRWEVEVCVRADLPEDGQVGISQDDRATLAMARELANISGGAVRLADTPDRFQILLTLPALNQVTVLVIDDNADALQLHERYTAGTRYRVVGLQDPDRVMDAVEQSEPQLVVLDVMMPQVDGWKVLGNLRHHPATADVPVIICTILTQERLARSLGASGFLKKPFTRQALLDTLNQQMSLVSLPQRSAGC